MKDFVFWGLFVAAALILVGYVVWMFSVEKRERQASQEDRP